jgi:hypothetical protein
MAARNRLLVLVVFGITTLASCGKRSAGVQDYLGYVSDPKNGLVQEKEIDGLVFELKYQPPQYMALNELKQVEIQDDVWDSTLQEYAGLEYCKLTVRCKDCEHVYSLLQQEEIDIEGVEAHLNFDGQRDFLLIQAQDTSKCNLYSFSKTYGLGKQLEIALAFEPGKGKSDGDRTVAFDASVFNRGVVKFRFKKDDLENIPTLTL